MQPIAFAIIFHSSDLRIIYYPQLIFFDFATAYFWLNEPWTAGGWIWVHCHLGNLHKCSIYSLIFFLGLVLLHLAFGIADLVLLFILTIRHWMISIGLCWIFRSSPSLWCRIVQTKHSWICVILISTPSRQCGGAWVCLICVNASLPWCIKWV